jgi:hypothetical protein
MKTNEGLVKFAEYFADMEKTIYMLGGFGRKLSWEVKAHFHSLLAKIQSGSAHTIRNQERIKQGIGNYCFDCVGLIKAYLWWDYELKRPNYKWIEGVYHSDSEGNCNTFWKQATEKGTINTMPDIPGIIVFIGNGTNFSHVGIYTGTVNGVKQYIEATPGLSWWKPEKRWGVVRTDETMRKWTHWGKHKFIMYLEKKKLLFKVGDYVTLNGYVYGNSTLGSIGQKFTERTGKITIIASPNSPAPYHLDRIGWVKEENLKPFIAPELQFKVGDKVKIRSTAVNYATGQKIPSWVKLLSFTIKQVGSVKYPDAVLLSWIVSWVSKHDIQKI